MAYERAEEIVRSQTNFAVANCICRQEMRVIGQGCDKPEETCLAFGMAADHYVRTGRGRAISQQDALHILQEAERVGLVLQPTNDKSPLAICACCGCCCGVLRHLKRHPAPASLVSTPFAAVLNADACIGCGACLPRCQMDALTLDGDKATLNPHRCIGCGLCVSVCPTGALALARKPAEAQPKVPRDIAQAYIKMGQGRGKMSYAELARMVAQSKLDRLAAPHA
jgi:ferredoxin